LAYQAEKANQEVRDRHDEDVGVHVLQIEGNSSRTFFEQQIAKIKIKQAIATMALTIAKTRTEYAALSPREPRKKNRSGRCSR
jgi:hypothetical protein